MPVPPRRFSLATYSPSVAYPGLRLVVATIGKAWTYRYAPPQTGKQRQLALGVWPAVGFGEAVAAWEKARGSRSKGVNVGGERRAEVRATKAKALALKNREKQTCAFVVERYLAEMVEVNRKAKGAAEARRMLERAIAPIARVPARELTKAQARAVIVGVAAPARRVAAMTRQELRACWCYASDQGWVEDGANPFGGKDLGGRFKASARTRVLTSVEAGALLRWMHEPVTYSRTVGDALELVLRTGLRSGEVCGIRMKDLVERAGVLWVEIPAERMKAGKANSAPLVGRAREIVEARMLTGSPLLFARRQREGDEPRAIEQKVLGVEVYAHAGRSKAAAYARRRMCPVRNWAPHDLRRTARTFLAELGCLFELGEAILAHTLPGVAGIYNRAGYEAQKIESLGKLRGDLDALAASHNVVLMNKRAA